MSTQLSVRWISDLVTRETFSFDSMAVISLRLRRFYVVTSVLAIGMAIVAAIVNAIVGPLNVVMWLVPVAILVFSAVTLILVEAVCDAADRPSGMSWMVQRLVGKTVTEVYFLVSPI